MKTQSLMLLAQRSTSWYGLSEWKYVNVTSEAFNSSCFYCTFTFPGIFPQDIMRNIHKSTSALSDKKILLIIFNRKELNDINYPETEKNK